MNRSNILVVTASLLISLPALGQSSSTRSPETIVVQKGEVIQVDQADREKLQAEVHRLMDQMSTSLRSLDQSWAIASVKNRSRTATSGTWPKEKRTLAASSRELVRLSGPVTPAPSPQNNIAVVYEKEAQKE